MRRQQIKRGKPVSDLSEDALKDIDTFLVLKFRDIVEGEGHPIAEPQ